MKKIFTLAVAVLLSTMCVHAQEGYDDTMHEFALGYGLWSNSQLLDIYQDIDAHNVASAKFDNLRFVGSVSLEYFYHAQNWFGVGAVFAFGNLKQDVYQSKQLVGLSKNNYFTLMPAVKFDWLRTKHIGLYSKFALGITYRDEKFDAIDNTRYDKKRGHFNWQVSALGVEAGGPRFRAFLELGMGEQGIARIGLRKKF